MVGVALDDGDVHHTVEHLVQHIDVAVLKDGQPHIRVEAVQLRHDRGKPDAAAVAPDADVDPQFRIIGGKIRKLLVQPILHDTNLFQLGQVVGPGLGDADGRGGAVKQTYAQFLLGAVQKRRQGRLGDKQTRCRAGNTLLLGQGS